jgi:hypothetical protein
VNNLLPPDQPLPPERLFPAPDTLFDRTGMHSSYTFVQPGRADSATDAASGAFVQGFFELLGIQVSTAGRGPAVLSSVNPLYQFRTAVDADGVDRRVFPFSGINESEVQLAISGTINVKRLVLGPSSHAVGHPTLEFNDRRSGRHLYVTAMTYGTPDPNADFLAADATTGIVIVGTTMRANTTFGRNLGIPVLPMRSGFAAENYWGWGGRFDYRIDRAEFQRILDAARTVDPLLSGDVRDYLLDNFHFNNEIAGDGEIGLNLAGFKLQILRR